MTLPASGSLSISQIAAEFDVSLPCVFPDAFYGKPGVPSAGALSVSDFYGLSNVVFSPSGSSATATDDLGASATVSCNLSADFTVTRTGGDPTLTPFSIGAKSVTCTAYSGTDHIGRPTTTIGSWHVVCTAAGKTHAWDVTCTARGSGAGS